MQTQKRHAKKLLMATSAVGAMLLAMIAPAAAFADAAVSDIDPNETGTIHITKLVTDQPGTPGNGTKIADPSGTPLPGATFEICQVKSVTWSRLVDPLTYKYEPVTTTIDLTTAEGWDNYADLNSRSLILTPFTDPTDSPGFDCSTGITDSNGELVFDNLPIGLYQIREIGVPSGYSANPAPFLVTIPTVDPTDTDNWMYEIWVYPKNVQDAATKTIDDQSAVISGDRITYTITLPLKDPELMRYDGVTFADKLDNRLSLDPPATPPVGMDVSASVSFNTDQSSDPVCDISNEIMTALMPPQGGGFEPDLSGYVTGIVMNPNTLSDCIAAYPDVNLIMTIHAKVVGDIGDGIITNTAWVFPNQASIDSNQPLVTNTVTTKWGDIVIHKTDQDKNPLEGVEFQLFYTEGSGAPQGPVPDSNGDPLTFTTDSHGIATIDAVRYSCFWNDEEAASPSDCRTYFVKETKAADGYVLLDGPIKVDLVDSVTTDVNVVNTRVTPVLPLTGGFLSVSALGMYGAGCLILLSGALLLMRSRRQQGALAG